MKKSIFLFFAAILCAMTANAQWYLMGTVTDWSSGKQMTGDSKVVSVTINLKANTSYELKIKNGNSWYGNGGTMSSTNNLAWGFSTSNGSNAKIKTTDAGDYTFTWYISDKKLSVTYPNHNYIVAGDGDVMEDDWSPNSTKNKMEKQDDGTYRLVKTNRSLSVKTYGYKLTVGSWSVNQYPNDNVALKVTAAGNYNVVFTYNPKNGQLSHELVPIYTITASANPATAGTITGAGTYAKDASVTLEATPNAGYKFVNWTVGGMEKSTETTYSFTASANVNAVANFELSDPEVPTYAISVSANDDAMGTVTGAGDYTEGSSVTLTATPKAGYRFVNWTVGSEVKSTEATYSFTASEALTIVANFEAIPKYDITVKAVVPEAWTSTTIGIHYWGDGISGTSTPVATEKDGNWNKYTIKDVLEGQSVNVIFLNGTSWGDDKSNQTADITGITEDKCFQISAKTLDSEGKCTFTEVDCAADIKPEGDVYTMMGVGELGLSWDLATTGNDMTKQTDGTYTLVKEGLDLATTGNYEYKVIKNHGWDWSVPSGNTNQKLKVDKAGTYTVTFTLSADKKKLTADAVRNTRTVAVTAENGKVEGIENNGVYILGKEVTLTATANDHYVFVNWTAGEEVVSTENPYMFTITADVDLVANFKLDTHTINATATNGTVTGAGTYNHGEEVTLTATPAEGYHFEKWSNESTENPLTITVTEDVELQAIFAINVYDVTAIAENGTVTGAGEYTHGTEVTLTATPAFDYQFVNWSNGSTDNPLTLTVAEDVTLEAIFAEVAPTEVKESGVFSISTHKTATFATGNLQYHTGDTTWRFAKQQYQVVGEQNINLGDSTFTGWIDMLGWSTSETYFGVDPSNSNELYDGEFVDWGKVFEGENWSTLSADEWKYLLNTRANATQLKQIATIDTILGIMLFPDAWVMPEGIEVAAKLDTNYNVNVYNYTVAQWDALEDAGAIFLPAAGRRTGGWGNMINYDQDEETNPENLNGGYYRHQDNTNIYCYYWTSTINEETKNVSYLHNIVALGNEKYTIGTGAVWGEKGRYGQSVRLAKVAYDKHTVTATATNGTVEGSGEYTHGEEVTLTATPDFDYEFVKWSNGATENPLTITVADDVTLEAIFEEVAVAEVEKPGVFSISAHKTATFATGNLQYNVGTQTWRFAKQQYQVVGEQNINLGDPAFTGWIDMLGWSTNDEGNNFGVNPSNVNELYDGEFVDWGTKMGEGWSTLSADEWKYLLNTRANATQLKQIATIDTILGIMLFPDAWVMPDGIEVAAKLDTNYNVNVYNYTVAQWEALEDAGAIFLPAAGRRTGGYGNMINYDQVEEKNEEMLNGGYYRHQDNTNIYCYYWTSTINEETKNVSYLHNIVALGNEKYTIGTGAVWGEKGRYGQSVRLAKVAYDKHTVTAIAENGTVTGAGEYTHGDTVTLTATPAEGYEFVNWTVGKDTVSTEATYTFIVEADVNLVANFQEVVPVITHTVTWYTAVDKTTEVTLEEGADITKPATDPEMEGYVFMGWTNECFVAEDGSDFTAIEEFGTADADKEYYAVFAEETITDGTASKTYSFDITPKDFNTTSYAANNTTKTSKATASDGSTLDVQWTSNQVMLQSSVMQWQKSKGYIYNNTDLKNIISVEVTSTDGTFTTYYGTSSQPSSNTGVGSGNGYFKINVGGATGKCSNIKITFAHVTSGEPTTTYSNYMTTCTPEKYTIEWSVNGKVTETTTVVEGDALVLPEAPAAPDACSDKVFKGWATTATVNADGSAIKWVGDTIIPESDNTYYAVFATERIDAENSEIESVTLAYAGGITTNMTVDGNNAATVGLNAEEWSVTAAKGGSNTAPGLNKDNDIRLYYNENGSNTITVSSLVENVTISNITITYTGDGYSNSKVLVNDAVVTGTDGTYTINANSFVITNGNTSNAQVRIKSIVINYTKPSITYTDYATTCKIPEYTVTFDYSVDAGYITVNDERISEKEVKYVEGTELTVKALTFNNYRFDAWMDEEENELSTEPTYTFTVTKDVVLKAIITYEQGAVGTSVENNNVVMSETIKVIQNGRLFIIRKGKIYNAQGQVVK